MRIEMLVFDGVDEMDVMGPFEVWSHASKRTELERAEEVRVEDGADLLGRRVQVGVRRAPVTRTTAPASEVI